jgi:hypothetical protein
MADRFGQIEVILEEAAAYYGGQIEAQLRKVLNA